MKVKQVIRKFHWLWFQMGLMALLLCVVMSAVNAAETDELQSDNAQAVVEHLQRSLIQAMRKGEQLDFEERIAFLSPVIDQTHDIKLIIKTILGATLWRQLDQSQQDLIVETFRLLSVATYAGRFKSYSGEQFELLEERDLAGDQKLVRSRLITGDGGSVNFDYVLYSHDGHWVIINILFDGVSDLAIKRSEYRSIMQREGFQSLIDMLNIKISEAEQNE